VPSRLGDRIEWLYEVQPKLTPVQFVVLSYQVLRCIDRKGKHWHSSRSIGDALNMSERAVQRVQLELHAMGYIDRTKRRSGGMSMSTVVYVLAPGVQPGG
jgi:DNA-binding MarR family transcriptional regulator